MASCSFSNLHRCISRIPPTKSSTLVGEETLAHCRAMLEAALVLFAAGGKVCLDQLESGLVRRDEWLDELVLDSDALDLLVVLRLGHDVPERSDLIIRQCKLSFRVMNEYVGESRTSCSSTRLHASPSFPARAVRPTRWTYLRMSAGMS